MALNREILRIALPSILSNITVPLLGLADVALTGHLGAVAYLGAIAVGGMLFNVIYWMFSFLRMGTSGHTAQAFGRNDPRDIMTGLGRSVTAALGISALLLLFRHPVGQFALHLIRPSGAVASLALLYYDICIWGAPAALLLFAVTGWYIGMQNARIPMWVAIVQNVVNISLSVFFVFVLGMKLEGVALGTVLAQYVGLAVALAFWWARYRHLRGELVWRDISDVGGMLRFFRTNKDLFLRTLCLIAIHFFFISAGAGFGDTALAVNTMLMQFFMLYSYIMDGFAFAGEAIVGRAVGACDKVLYRSTDAGVVSAAMAYQPWTLLIPLCSVATFVWDGVFIGELNTRGMLLAMASGLVAFFALYAWWAPLYGNHGLWAAFLSYLAVRGLTQTVYKFL